MGFLNFSLLFGLFLGGIPLIIHLLNRQKRVKIDFSSIKFIHQINQKRMKKIKLKKILLLIIRTLMVLLIVLAIARPIMKNNSGIFSSFKSNLAYVFIIDNSASSSVHTQNGTYLDYLKDYSKKMIDLIGEGQLFYIVSIHPENGRLQVQESGNVLIANKIINKLAATEYSFSWDRAFSFLNEEFQNLSAPIHSFFLLGDLQKLGWSEQSYEQFKEKFAQVNFEVVHPQIKDVNNIRIDSVFFANPNIAVGVPLTFKAVLSNQNSMSVENILIDLFIDEQRVAQKSTKMSGQSQAIIDFEVVLKKSGVKKCVLKISEDDFAADNQYNFTLAIPEKIRFLLVSDSLSQSDFHIQKSISPLDSAAVFEVDYTDLMSLNLMDINQYQGMIVNQVDQYPYFLISHIRSFLQMKKKVVLIPNLESDFSQLNRSVFDYFKLSFNVQQLDQSQEGEYFSLEINPSDSIYFSLKEQEYWQPIKIFQKFNFLVSEAQGVSVPLYFHDRTPALIQSNCLDGEMFVFGFSLNEQASNFIFHSMMVPFFQQLASYLGTSEDLLKPLSFNSGELIYHKQFSPLPAKLYQDRKEVKLINNDPTDFFMLKPGHYEVVDFSQNKKDLFVNIPDEESSFNPDQEDQSYPFEIRTFKEITEMESFFKSLISGLELSYYALLLTLILFIIESWLAREN